MARVLLMSGVAMATTADSSLGVGKVLKVMEVAMPKVEPPPWEGREVSINVELRTCVNETYTTHCPEQVLVLALVGSYNLATGSYHFHLIDLIGGETIAGSQQTVSGAGQIATQRDGLPAAAYDGLVDGIERAVQIPHLHTSTRGDSGAINGNLAAARAERIKGLEPFYVMDPDGQ